EPAKLPDLVPMLPEIVLVLGAMALLMLGAFRGDRMVQVVNSAAIALLVLAVLIIAWLPAGRLTTFGGSIVVDDFARFIKILTLIGSAATILISLDYFTPARPLKFEYAVLIVLSTAGMLMMISAADLIALYLGLELMSLSLYVLAAIERDSVRATE